MNLEHSGIHGHILCFTSGGMESCACAAVVLMAIAQTSKAAKRICPSCDFIVLFRSVLRSLLALLRPLQVHSHEQLKTRLPDPFMVDRELRFDEYVRDGVACLEYLADLQPEGDKISVVVDSIRWGRTRLGRVWPGGLSQRFIQCALTCRPRPWSDSPSPGRG